MAIKTDYISCVYIFSYFSKLYLSIYSYNRMVIDFLVGAVQDYNHINLE